MTSRIEQTRCTMYKALAALKAGGRWLMKKQNAEAFETALEEHLEDQRHLIERQRQAIADLYMSRRTLVSQVEQLSHELDVLKMANEAAGEELRIRNSECNLNSVGLVDSPIDKNTVISQSIWKAP